jgi:integrase
LYMDRAERDRAKGLGLRVRRDGSRGWIFFYRIGGAQKRLTIGNASNDPSGWTLEKARNRARALRVDVDHGRDPQVERAALDARAREVTNARTVKDVADTYLATRAADMKPRSLEECTRHLNVLWKPIHGLGIKTIDGLEIADQLEAIENDSGPVARNRARSTLSAMFAWAIGRGWCDRNPVGTTNKSKEASRDRVLTDTELAAIWKATPDNGYGRIVRLLMLTAQRREEIGGLRWSEIESLDAPGKALIALPSDRTKNHRPHDVPLSTTARSVLLKQPQYAGREAVFGEGEGGYSGWSRSKDRLDADCDVKDWTLHDLRRTTATRMADLGVQPHVIEAVLNHVSGHKAGVAGIYNRSTYAAEKRAALELWANHINLIVAQAEGANVTRLKRKP